MTEQTEREVPAGQESSAGVPRRSEFFPVLSLCGLASLVAAVWSWRAGAMLYYGDAIAHLHIARRVFDCRFVTITQLGSVWLPLPHILMLPFVQSYTMWANGLAGTIPSMLAYVAACVGLYRLARHWLTASAAALALAFFALNPNLLYLQTTAMTEPLFLAELIWIVLGVVEWHASLDAKPQRTARPEGWIAVALVAAIFTRYDGWIVALLVWSGMGVALLKRGELRSRSYWLASIAVVAAPVAWFAYNSVAFGDWLYFARGPYSALAIEARTAVHSSWPLHPGWHNPWVALIFFVKSAEMNAIARGANLVLALSGLGTIAAWLTMRYRNYSWALLLWIPVPFYAYSVAFGSVPIFLPVWWPHSWYNTRYGVELLPALALGLGFCAHLLLSVLRTIKLRWTKYAVTALFALVAINSIAIARKGPLVYVEGEKNYEARLPFDRNIPPLLRALLAELPGAQILMNTSVYPELVSITGIPLRQTINESDRHFFSDALNAPAAHAEIILAFAGDEVDRAVKAHPESLTAVARFTAKDQPDATIYVSDTPGLR